VNPVAVAITEDEEGLVDTFVFIVNVAYALDQKRVDPWIRLEVQLDAPTKDEAEIKAWKIADDVMELLRKHVPQPSAESTPSAEIVFCQRLDSNLRQLRKEMRL
jgi:hypothetical protein